MWQTPYESFLDAETCEGPAAGEHDAPRELWRGEARTKRGCLSRFIYSPQFPTGAPHEGQAPAVVRRKILDYDFDSVCHWAGIIGLFTRASVLRISHSLSICMMMTLALFALTLVAAHLWNADKSQMDTSAMESLQQRVIVMVTFLLGFFISENISRWWKHRTCLGQIHGCLADLVILC